MFKLTLVTFSLLGFIGKAQTLICDANIPCVVDGNSSRVVIANRNVPSLIVSCSESNQCKRGGIDPGLIVYSSANTTLIDCSGEDSCIETSLNFGVTPQGSLPLDFEVTRKQVQVTCSGKQSCKSIRILNQGIVTNGLLIDTPDDPVGNIVGAFLDGLAECGFDTQCILECGTDLDTCKDAKCYDKCNCLGSACPDGVNDRPLPPTNQDPSASPVNAPTSSPVVVIPTARPTEEPAEIRNITVCDVESCVLEPGNYYDVVCPESINVCNINCIEEGQCSDGVIILANSASVILTCGAINACGKIELSSSNPASVVQINAIAEKSAVNLDITINGGTLKLVASGKESFENGKISCDGECSVQCIGKDSCKSAIYECLSPQNTCLLDCDTENNQCPIIYFFGDPSCEANIPCNIVPDGNKRIVVPNNVPSVTIDCSQSPQQCKQSGSGLKVFSAAGVTNLVCDAQDGCEGIQLCVGQLTGDRVPKGFEASEFLLKKKITVTANCDFDSACKEMYLYAEGNVSVIISGNGDNSLQDNEATCNGCASLDYICREFDGCVGSSIFCTNAASCSCVSGYEVDIGNDSSVLATTEAPRDSCPSIQTIILRQHGSASINTNVVNTTMNTGMKFLIPMLIVGAILVFGVVFIKNYNKSYKEIDGKNSKFIKNENIYATYQVEMH